MEDTVVSSSSVWKRSAYARSVLSSSIMGNLHGQPHQTWHAVCRNRFAKTQSPVKPEIVSVMGRKADIFGRAVSAVVPEQPLILHFVPYGKRFVACVRIPIPCCRREDRVLRMPLPVRDAV